jgi:hypothetical protein
LIFILPSEARFPHDSKKESVVPRLRALDCVGISVGLERDLNPVHGSFFRAGELVQLAPIRFGTNDQAANEYTLVNWRVALQQKLGNGKLGQFARVDNIFDESMWAR